VKAICSFTIGLKGPENLCPRLKIRIYGHSEGPLSAGTLFD